ncbi:MAG: DM13 domain-containing protein [Candidatus Acidiferrales bacterium]
MSKRTLLVLLGLVVLAGGWFLFRPELLFVKTTVNESFPATTSASGGPMALSMGNFHGVAHETRGTATVYELPDGKRVLRFTNFETSNGPDVQVYLVAAADASDNDTVTKAGFIHLGALKGTTGDQNYDVPADADLSKYQSVTVWCRRFGVNFATAPLQASGPRTLAAGDFHGVAHETRGTATVYELPDGKRVLRFTNFETSNGPDVQVYLVAAPDASDNDTVTKAGFIHLGALKGTTGDQNYDVPADADLSKYQSVTVWCRRFGVNFATAPLR